MKKIMIAAFSMLFMVGMASAQQVAGNHAPQHKVQKHHKWHKHHRKGKMGHHLALNEDQKKQAKTIGENYHKQVAALQKNDNITMGEYRKQMAALQNDRKTKMQGLLTTEQKAKIAEGKQKMQENAQVRNAARLERMKINLGLKDDQIAKIKKQQDAFKNKAKAIRDNDALSQEQKRTQMQALAKEHKDSFRNILTKEQQEKMDSKRKDFRDNKADVK